MREVDGEEHGAGVAFGNADERGFLDMERHEFLVLSSTRLSVVVIVHRACWREIGGRITFTFCLIIMQTIDRTSATGKKVSDMSMVCSRQIVKKIQKYLAQKHKKLPCVSGEHNESVE